MEPTFSDLRLMLEARLALRASEDPEFRQRLIAAPHAALAEEFGKSLPEGLKLQVIDAPADTLTIVLPPAANADGELSDAELALVSGGSLWTDFKRWLGGGEFQPSTQTAVAGVRG